MYVLSVLFTGLLIINSCYSLECYSCNVSSSSLALDGCDGIGSLKQCPPNSVCLSAQYEVKTGSVSQFTTMQTCYPDMIGQECSFFIKGQRDLFWTATIESETCYACSENNCNRNISGGDSIRLKPVIFISSLLCVILTKLLIM